MRSHRSIPNATRAATSDDLAWAAGFMEGEAHFSRPASGTTCIRIEQVNREPLDKLQEMFGGTVNFLKPRRPTHQPAWYWVVAGARARGVAKAVRPLMSKHRQSQIEAALAGSDHLETLAVQIDEGASTID